MRCLAYHTETTSPTMQSETESSKPSIGPYDDILTTVKKCKLKWLGCLLSSAGLAKTILQGTVQGREEEAENRSIGRITSLS